MNLWWFSSILYFILCFSSVVGSGEHAEGAQLDNRLLVKEFNAKNGSDVAGWLVEKGDVARKVVEHMKTVRKLSRVDPAVLASELHQCLQAHRAVARVSDTHQVIRHSRRPGTILMIPKSGSSTLVNNVAPSKARLKSFVRHKSTGWRIESVSRQADPLLREDHEPRAVFVREPFDRFVSAIGTLFDTCNRHDAFKAELRWELAHEGLGFLCDDRLTQNDKIRRLIEDMGNRGPRNEHLFSVAESLGRFWPYASDGKARAHAADAPPPLQFRFVGQIERFDELYPLLQADWGLPNLLVDQSRPGVHCEHCNAYSLRLRMDVLRAIGLVPQAVRRRFCASLALDFLCVGQLFYGGGSDAQLTVCRGVDLAHEARQLGAGGDKQFNFTPRDWGRNIARQPGQNFSTIFHQ